MVDLRKDIGDLVYRFRAADTFRRAFDEVLECTEHEAVLLLHPTSGVGTGGLWCACFQAPEDEEFWSCVAVFRFLAQDHGGVNTWALVFASHAPDVFTRWLMPRTFRDFARVDDRTFRTSETHYVHQFSSTDIRYDLRGHWGDREFAEIVWRELCDLCYSPTARLDLSFVDPFRKRRGRFAKKWSRLLAAYDDASSVYVLFHDRFRTACPYCLAVGGVVDHVFSFVSTDLYPRRFRERHADLRAYEERLRRWRDEKSSDVADVSAAVEAMRVWASAAE